MSLSTATTFTTTTSTMTTTTISSAPLVTTSVITTEISLIDASIVTSCLTTWDYYYTTITATRGQTITFSTPTVTFSSTPSAIPTTKIFPTYEFTYLPTITTTTTITEIAVYLQSPSATTVYSTWTLPITSTLPPQVTNVNEPGQLVYVVSPAPAGWDSWSDGTKAGLIVGVILGALLLLMLLWCCCKRMRDNEWIAHDWRWARNVEGGPAPGANTVPTVQVGGVLDTRLATPYGYGGASGYGGGYGYGQQGHPGWGWMRGGGREEGFVGNLIGKLRDWSSQTIFVDQSTGEQALPVDKVRHEGEHDEQQMLRSTAVERPYF